MQDNFNMHEWRLNQTLKEIEEATFTSKHDDNPKLKGGQKELPDELQAGILKKEASLNVDFVDDDYADPIALKRDFEIDDVVKVKATGKKGKVVDMSPSETFFIVNIEGKNYSFHGSDLKLIKRPSLNEGEDHEVAMAQNSLKSIISSASQLMAKLGDNERNIPGWIQDHITNAENYIDQANQGFHELNEASYSQTSYTHMRPFKLEIANIMSQLGALNDKIEQNGPLSEEIIDALESLGTLISNINTSRRI